MCAYTCLPTQLHAQALKQKEDPLGDSESNFKCHLDPWAGPPLFNMTYNAVSVFIFFTRGLYKNSKKDY